ncbi:MAG: chondroitinase [Tannerellaceae bacterium]|nr:chondroitinase [Tannerellaceae bacterium]
MQKNTFLFLFLSLCYTLAAQPDELQTLQKNYVNALLASDPGATLITEQLLLVEPETELSDQAVVELHQRYPLNKEKTGTYLQSLQADGTWPDINYADTKRSGWEPKKHAERIVLLCKQLHTMGKHEPLAAALTRGIHQALAYWFREKPVCPNWWYNQIGVPKTLGQAFILFRDELTPEELQSAIEVMKQAKFGMTGQNKVWLAGNVLIRALLEENYDLVKEARNTIVSEITTGSEEGIKSDWSFHQHGPQQQFGNYGLSYLNEMSFYSGLFSNTSLALNTAQQTILDTYLLEGYRWVIWKNHLDINCLNRQLFHNAPIHKAFSVAFAANSLSQGSSPENIKELQAFIDDNLNGQSGTTFTGHKHFWDSDMTIHRTSKWMASVKMASERIIGTELVNEDNLKGYYMADGATYIYRQGDEYLNIFPLWDWRKIPGITAYHTPAPIPTNYDTPLATNQTTFVGGVTNNKEGISAMIFNRDGIEARKAWIFTDKYVLCLGSEIKTDSMLPVATSIDQRIKKGELSYYHTGQWKIVENEIKLQDTIQYFHHDHTGYILLQPDSCIAFAGTKTGQWHDFMGMYQPATVQEDIISLYILHPATPATYQYILLPDATKEETNSFDKNSIRIIRNDREIQAVAIDNQIYIAGYSPASLPIAPSLHIEIETPGLYLFSLEGKSPEIYTADPTHIQKEMKLRINKQELTITFPADHPAGKTFKTTFPYK